MAESLVGGAVVGAVFGELLKAVLETTNKAIMFKQTLIYLRSTLVAIAPVVKEIEQHNNDLGHPKEELESLIRIMQEGIDLVHKCSNIHWLNCVAKVRYHKQLVAVVDSLVKFFIIDMQAQVARDQKETLLKVRRIYSYLFNRENTRASSSDSARQVMEPITGTKQEAGQCKAKAGNNQGMKHLVSEKGFSGGFNNQVKKGTCIERNNKFYPHDDTANYNKLVPPEKRVFLDSSYSFNLEDLLSASNETLGKGSYGTTFKTSLEDGTTVALKRLREVMGIAHIHSASGMNFVHGNIIKSSNVLVTADFKGCISDFDITRLLGLSVIPSGNKGYLAPEVIETGKLTQKSDVYSFGILLLEMLTGKSLEEDPDLQGVDGLLHALFDDAIKYEIRVWGKALNIMRLARACVSMVPDMRPSMDQVVWEMWKAE